MQKSAVLWDEREVEILKQANCCLEEQRACLQTVRNGISLICWIEANGILALSEYLPECVELNFLEIKAYELLAKCYEVEAIRGILLRYMITSHFSGKELLVGLITARFLPLLCGAISLEEGKEQIISLLGAQAATEAEPVFSEVIEKKRQEKRRKWMTTDWSCQIEDEESLKERSVEVLALAETLRTISDESLEDRLRKISDVAADQEKQNKLLSELVLAFKIMSENSAHKIKRNMPEAALTLVYEKLLRCGPVRVQDCEAACRRTRVWLQSEEAAEWL